MKTLHKKLIAEFTGTFFMILFGCGSIIVNQLTGAISHLGVAIVWGIVVAVMISATGHISMAHFNPAVTIALLQPDTFPRKKFYLTSFLKSSVRFSPALPYSSSSNNLKLMVHHSHQEAWSSHSFLSFFWLPLWCLWSLRLLPIKLLQVRLPLSWSERQWLWMPFGLAPSVVHLWILQGPSPQRSSKDPGVGIGCIGLGRFLVRC